MEIILKGIRGSIASPSPSTSFYGGNTLCIELSTNNGTLLYFDAGTGIREAGDELPNSGECHLFISHAHIDHITGLWFFKPIHSPDWTTRLYLPAGLEHIPNYLFTGGLFPISFDKLQGKVITYAVKAGEKITIGKGEERIVVTPFTAHHPGISLGYRVEADDTTFLYTGDYEITADNKRDTTELIKGSDIVAADGMYSRASFKAGWGHSAWEDWVEVGEAAKIGSLVLVHHEPTRSDHDLDEIGRDIKDIKSGLNAFVGREGGRFNKFGPIPNTQLESDWIFTFLDDLALYREESALLDRILAKAREITRADAGTIYLREGDELIFSYTHNDSLFSVNQAYRYAYSNIKIPISTKSIAGYAAVTGRQLLHEDVYNLPSDVPYTFNRSFDEDTGYRTKSMLTLPFFAEDGMVAGVLQLINCMNLGAKTPCPFSHAMAHNARLLAHEAAGILARGRLERKNIYGILRMAKVHDPSETGPHAERVGSLAAEIYQRLGEREEWEPGDIRYEKSRIRLAAMLHDIGKVGISDLILKKPAKLSDEEFEVMKTHTEMGYSILAEDEGDIASFARDIALHHHQKYNGRGYPQREGKTLKEEEIPLAARITAIADVFDALVSHRCYKKSWSFEEALALLEKEAGEHFDPKLVECMLDIKALLKPIYERFPDEE